VQRLLTAPRKVEAEDEILRDFEPWRQDVLVLSAQRLKPAR
jgi:hypothetical protein